MSIVERFAKRVKEIKDNIGLWLEWHVFGCVEIPSLSDEDKETIPSYMNLADGTEVPVYTMK